MRNMDQKSGFKSIDEYIAACPSEIQAVLTDLRNAIREAAPEAREKISYQMPTFDYFGNLVHFAAYEKHIGFYPAPSGIDKFSRDLAPYKSSKGAVQFPVGHPIPIDLIKEIVKFRVSENNQKETDRKNLRGGSKTCTNY